ncbi:MAG: hypothetical protein ABI763_09335 [Bacteroidota bacterium]
MKKLNLFFAVVLLAGIISSCKKEYVYEVKDVKVTQPGGAKDNVKTTTEFISIVYSDLFNNNIPTDTLLYVQQSYDAFGDKKLIEDRIVRHFLNSPAVQIPADATMRANIPLFVDETIQKFFNRKPDAFENYFISDIISNSTNITPMMVYYACMTSNEYRYY